MCLCVEGKLVKVQARRISEVHETFGKVQHLPNLLGAGVDMAQDDAYISATDAASVYEYNGTAYANVRYNLSKELQLGLEYQYMQTEWVDGSEGDANRIMSALIYKF